MASCSALPLISFRTFSGKDPNYTTLRPLGKGSFGTVTKVKRERDGKILACKSLKFKHHWHIEAAKQEIELLRILQECRNVVRWDNDVSIDLKGGYIHLHMEFYPDGDLGSYIQSTNGPIRKNTIAQIFVCLAEALYDIHRKGILHRDIKPQNILLSQRASNGKPVMVAVLADFGVGKLSTATLMSGRGHVGTCYRGTKLYMAPESFGRSPLYGRKTDIFSIGCVMYEAMTKRRAFIDDTRLALPSMPSRHRQTYGNTLVSFVYWCMELSPSNRTDTPDLFKNLKQYASQHWSEDDFNAFFDYHIHVQRPVPTRSLSPRRILSAAKSRKPSKSDISFTQYSDSESNNPSGVTRRSRGSRGQGEIARSTTITRRNRYGSFKTIYNDPLDTEMERLRTELEQMWVGERLGTKKKVAR